MDAGSSTQTQTEQPKQDPMIAEAMRLDAIGLERDGKKPDATGEAGGGYVGGEGG